MKILIVAATETEIRPLLSRFASRKNRGQKIKYFIWDKLEIDLLITGVRMIPTAFSLGKTLAANKYDFIINGGIAGAYDPGLELGKVVHVTKDCIAEFGVYEENRFTNFFELNVMDPDVFPFRSGYLINEKWPDLPILHDLPRCTGNTIDRIHATPGAIDILMTHYPAEVETMEGAAFLYGCLNEKVSCVQIRAISNHVRERDKSRWKIPLSVENLNNTIIKILQDYVHKAGFFSLSE